MSLFNLFNKNTEKEIYQAGQEWHYQTRNGEENSTLKIVKTEHYENIGRMIHIAISGVKIKNPKYPNGVLEEVLHIPIAEEALRNSTTQLKNDCADLPDYEFGYVRWKTAFLENKAGYFGIPVKEIIQYLEDGTYNAK
jgi:hypothetical protein